MNSTCKQLPIRKQSDIFKYKRFFLVFFLVVIINYYYLLMMLLGPHPNAKGSKRGGSCSLAWSPIKPAASAERRSTGSRTPTSFSCHAKRLSLSWSAEHYYLCWTPWTDRPAANPLERCDPPFVAGVKGSCLSAKKHRKRTGDLGLCF